jgi:hypothetical protein
MKTEIPIGQLLRWRLSQAEADAPPAPRAARLLELARPWWETWPEQFRSLLDRLGRIQMAYGHAMAEPRQSRGGGFPVPALIVLANQETESFARVLYFNIRDGRLLLRFQLDAVAAQAPERLEATFVADQSARPLLCAPATLSVDAEYRIDAELPAELAHDWEQLKVTDRMPFRLLLRSDKQVG